MSILNEISFSVRLNCSLLVASMSSATEFGAEHSKTLEDLRQAFYEDLHPSSSHLPVEDRRQAFYEDVRPSSSHLPVQPEPQIARTSDAASTSDPSLNPEFPLGFISVEDALRTRRVFRSKNMGFISFHGMERLSTTVDWRDMTTVWPRHLNHPFIYSNKHPFTPFILQNPTYHDEFLKVLNVSYHGIPFIVEGSKYRMRPDLVEKWSCLEEAIQNIIDVFISRNIYLSNLDFRRNRRPHKYGYVNLFSTLDELRRRVMDSKHAFGIHIAFASFLIAGASRLIIEPVAGSVVSSIKQSSVHQFEEPGMSLECWPLWCRDAVDNFGVHPVFMHAFLFSEINDFRKQRVGCFIETANCEILYAVHQMLECRIPFIVMWPLDDPEYGLNTLWELAKNVREAVQLSNTTERLPMLAEWEAELAQSKQPQPPLHQTPEDPNEVDWSEPQQSWGVEEEESDGLNWAERAAGFDERRRQAMLAKAVDWRKWFIERDEKYMNTEYSLKDRHAFQQKWDNTMLDGGTLAKSLAVVLWTKVSDDPPLWV